MKKLITIGLLFVTSLLSAGEVTLTAEDGFQLKADYYTGKYGYPAVILLHQCNGDRSMYQDVGKRLAEAGIHALALDFRGFGGSTNDRIDIMAFRDSTSDRQVIQAYSQPIIKHWVSDTNIAVDFLRECIGEDIPMGAGGASCGGRQTVILAGQRDISALMIFSSGIDGELMQQYHSFEPTSTLFIAAEGDKSQYKSAMDLFSNASHPHSRMIVYKGNAHGAAIFKQDPTLVNVIADWYILQLKRK